MELWILRAVLAAVLTASAAVLNPLGAQPWISGAVGLLLAIAAIGVEHRIRAARLGHLVGAAVGAVFGLFAALLISVILGSNLTAGTASLVSIAALAICGYIGVVIGTAQGESLPIAQWFGKEQAQAHPPKVLDTSVIIDGRVADIAESGFLDGPLVVPQFVLWELQLVADSADSQKRARGRRGLDIIQRMQKSSAIDVQVVDTDFPKIKEVDLKLVELSKQRAAKLLTNDFNLNKVARVQGVDVLNINALANAVKPVVLPGETMEVYILKEGKEYNQGVAYLDDGTMVVVDNARKHISKTVEVSVTSVLQTTAGKMIFGRLDERSASGNGHGRRGEQGGRTQKGDGEPAHRLQHTTGR